MAQTVFIGREFGVPADELPDLATGQMNPANELGMFLHLTDSESHGNQSHSDESRETSPLPLLSSVEPVVSEPEKSDMDESPRPMKPAPGRKTTKKTKSTKMVQAATKTPQRRHRRKQMEIYGTTAPRRSSRVPSAAPGETSRASSKKTSASNTGISQKRGRKPGRKSSQTDTKKQNPTSKKQWEVESIVDSQIDADTLEHFYKVKWKGYSSKENTWEPKSNLVHCQDALKKYERQNKK